VFFVNSSLLFPTPLPGEIPFVVIWITLFKWSIEEDASASINITSLVFVFSISDLIIVDVSIPVVPVTSGLNIAVFWYDLSTSPRLYK